MINNLEHLEWRYAVKKFDPNKMLHPDKIEGLKEAFNLTATSYGLQPIKLVVIRNKEIQRELVPNSYGQEQVFEASDVLVICIENTIDEAYINKHFNLIKKIRGTSDEILNPFKESLIKSFSKKEAKEVNKWSTNQAYIALGNMLSYCALEKIDSCPMEGFLSEKYNELLGLTELGLSSVLVLPIGIRHEDDMFSLMKKVRKPLKESVIVIE